MTKSAFFKVLVLGCGLVVPALVISGSALAQTQSPAKASDATLKPSHVAAAKELVGQTQMAKSLDVFVPQLGLRLLGNITRTRPELKKDLDTVLDKVVPELEKEKSILVDKVAVFFAEAMSEEEIRKVIEFNNTPAGKKFLAQQPKVLDRMVVVMDDWNRDMSERMLTRVREEMKKKGHDI
ncbi:MAG: DUF2059 domain-containing protein [Beijerinckiaceae bacterium]|nr:DUF2059 domain-containing protein [Beijerinckiaceae bacterium]